MTPPPRCAAPSPLPSGSIPSPAARPLSVLLVDDEPPARRRLRQLLAAQPGAHVVGEAASVAEARVCLAEQRPDLAFIDIELRDADAFELFGSVPFSTAVVFVTAHTEHALRAFECEVLDYLLKPVRPERLARALGRAERWRARNRAGFDDESTAPARGSSLALRHRQELLIVACDDVLFITARDDHSELYLKNGASHLDATRMDAWEQRLPATFLRTHRSHIVNLRAALALSRRRGGWVIEIGREHIPVSRSRLEAVRAALGAGEPR